METPEAPAYMITENENDKIKEDMTRKGTGYRQDAFTRRTTPKLVACEFVRATQNVVPDFLCMFEPELRSTSCIAAVVIQQ